MKDAVTKRVKGAGQKVDSVGVPMSDGMGMLSFVKKTVKEAAADHASAYAGNLAYHGMLAIFPFFILLLSILGTIGNGQLLRDLVERAAVAMPDEASALLTDQVAALTQDGGSGLAVSAVVSALVALWAVSGGFRSVMQAMNVMYEVEEARPAWKKYGMSVVFSIMVAAIMLVAVVLVVAGPAIAEWVASFTGMGAAVEWAWKIGQWPLLFAMVLFSIALVYYLAPAVEQRFRFVSPGSLFAGTLWLVFSLAFSAYVNNFGSYNKTYGAAAGVVILLLYMYYSSFIFLVGAEMNQVIEQHNPSGKDKGERKPGDTTPGADGGSDSAAHKHRGRRNALHARQVSDARRRETT